VKRWIVGVLAAVLSAVTPISATAQGAYPDHALKIVVPLPPGGSPDTIARTLAQSIQERWMQPVVVENKTGGSQNIGADTVAKSTPDGYTWLLAPDNVFVTNPYLAKAADFDPLKDLAPVTLVARIQFLLVVHPSVPAKSVAELVAYAKAHPNELNFGCSGTGSAQHLGGLLLQHLSGTKMNHVPYKGAAPAVTDLLAGRIQVWIGAANSLLPHIKADRVRLLTTTAPQRSPVLADTPTVAESGVPGYSLYPWLALFVPAKTPPDIVGRINSEVARVLNSPEVKARLVPQGMDLVTGSPADLAALIRDEYASWGKVIREAGLKGE